MWRSSSVSWTRSRRSAPYGAKAALRFAKTCRVCAIASPSATLPSAASGTCPETKISGPSASRTGLEYLLTLSTLPTRTASTGDSVSRAPVLRWWSKPRPWRGCGSKAGEPPVAAQAGPVESQRARHSSRSQAREFCRGKEHPSRALSPSRNLIGEVADHPADQRPESRHVAVSEKPLYEGSAFRSGQIEDDVRKLVLLHDGYISQREKRKNSENNRKQHGPLRRA